MKRHVKASEESGFIYSEHERFDRPNWLLVSVVAGVVLLHFCTESMAHSFTRFHLIILYFHYILYNESHLYSLGHRTTI